MTDNRITNLAISCFDTQTDRHTQMDIDGEML